MLPQFASNSTNAAKNLSHYYCDKALEMGNSCAPGSPDKPSINSPSSGKSKSDNSDKNGNIVPFQKTADSKDKPSKRTSLQGASLTDEELSEKQAEAAKRIQRLSRRKKAIKKATIEQQWKIFADLDTKDEADMLHLAMFFQTLMDKVPGLDKYGSTRELNYDPTDEDTYDTTIYLDNIQVEEESTNIDGDYNNYDIGKAQLTLETVGKMIEVCRRHGHFHFNTVVKVLRASYKILKGFPNVRNVKLSAKQRCTVVGDIHGNIMDLLYILDDAGLPGPNNVYIFNGDFVDRGDNSVEVICILLALLSADPENVYLNRGNHEDEAVCRVYGFQNEVIEKYNLLAFEMFSEVFKHMPLATVVNDSVFVVHGGIAHDADMYLRDLDHINRTDYVAKPEIEFPQNAMNLSEEDFKVEYCRQLQRDLMWSDPCKEPGIHVNDRGAGMTFGPDIAVHFMSRNSLTMIIRSHECVYNGFDRSYFDDDMTFTQETTPITPIVFSSPPLVCTLFSASNYCGGDNYGAYLTILSQSSTKNSLNYYVRRYKTSVSDMTVVEKKNKSSLSQLILRKKLALTSAFEEIDTAKKNVVSRLDWAEVMQRITQIQIRWLAIIDGIAPASCLTPKTVNYRVFLESFSPNISLKDHPDGASTSTIAAMYAQRGKLEAIFNFFDLNGDGVSVSVNV
jgi:serine/threonine-protein phosphatase with EF-hands